MTCRHATHGSSQSKGDGIELLPDVSGQHAEKAELILIALVGHAKTSGALFSLSKFRAHFLIANEKRHVKELAPFKRKNFLLRCGNILFANQFPSVQDY